MSVTWLLPDDVTLADALTFGPTASGATSPAQVLHAWNAKGTPGGLLTNVNIQAVDPDTGLDSGVKWLDETWLEARINGGANPGADPAFTSVTTDWYKLGAGLRLPVPDLPGNCALYVEVRQHPPLKDGAASESLNGRLDLNYSASALSLVGAIADLGQGIVTGIGDLTVTEWIDAPAVTASGPADDEVHVAVREYLSAGAVYRTTTPDDLTLDQDDSAAATLTAAHEYRAVISQPPGAEAAAVVTKGLLAATGEALVPTTPAGNLLIAVVTVAYGAGGSVVNTADITSYALGGRGKPTAGELLTVVIAPLRAILAGGRLVNRSARTVAVPPSDESWIWLSSADELSVTDSAAPPFAGALAMCSAVADGTEVTSVTDLRRFWQPGLVVADYADNATALAAGLIEGMLYRNGDALQIVHA